MVNLTDLRLIGYGDTVNLKGDKLTTLPLNT